MPRTPRPKMHQRPSPLQQVHHTRPLSHAPPEMGLVRDPAFWKRFSTAVHRSGEYDKEAGLDSAASSVDVKLGDEWLAQQHRERRRCRVMCVGITVAVVVVVAAAAVVGWYFVHARA